MDRETKNEFGKVRSEMSAEFAKLHTRLDQMVAKFANTFVTTVEFDMFKEDLFARMCTKKQFDDHMVLMDWATRKLASALDKQDIFQEQFCELDDKVDVHEKRLRALENSVK